MKKLLIIIVILLVACTKIQAKTIHKSAPDTVRILPDGQYYADISYFNYPTNNSAEYNLKVRVRSGQVIIIHLDNGGILHYGINNEGYLYTGGMLKAHKDKKTNKLEYNAQVSISNGNTISTYNITITREAPDDVP